ncbi:hypothetical protein GCM10017781_31260 [Deinococcus metalli]|uniref:Uncharacterized protein n=1 Tax=Deinococcus metalli TaxID=1141878 RepID=A0ABQ3JRT5_9DEIO|nr:hypothetical protein GCM10017781_31260 [Deinococcus metalli]
MCSAKPPKIRGEMSDTMRCVFRATVAVRVLDRVVTVILSGWAGQRGRVPARRVGREGGLPVQLGAGAEQD